MNDTDLPERPARLSSRVAAAEADIAETRRRLDGALSDIRHELVLPFAAASRAAVAALDRPADIPADIKEIGNFMRRHAAPLGVIGLGAAWLAFRCRGTLAAFGAGYARDLMEFGRDLGERASEAALSAVVAELKKAAPPAPQESGAPAAETTADPFKPE